MISENTQSLDNASQGLIIENNSRQSHFPQWLKRPIPVHGKKNYVEHHLKSLGLHTVCREAKCPNRCECYGKGRATFLIMGNVCSRNCSFCSVSSGNPFEPDSSEPQNILNVVQQLNLKYVVITSVTRDDLPDGGAVHFATIVRLLKDKVPGVKVEILVPDFQGNKYSLQLVLESAPDVFNHNIETVQRLYREIRPQANYNQSLEVLKYAAKYNKNITTKSGLMVGLGESENEVIEAMHDLRNAFCEVLTIGQYLQPSKDQVTVKEFISPQQFDYYTAVGQKMGFSEVLAAPFVRSSYGADKVFENVHDSEIKL